MYDAQKYDGYDRNNTGTAGAYATDILRDALNKGVGNGYWSYRVSGATGVDGSEDDGDNDDNDHHKSSSSRQYNPERITLHDDSNAGGGGDIGKAVRNNFPALWTFRTAVQLGQHAPKLGSAIVNLNMAKRRGSAKKATAKARHGKMMDAFDHAIEDANKNHPEEFNAMMTALYVDEINECADLLSTLQRACDKDRVAKDKGTWNHYTDAPLDGQLMFYDKARNPLVDKDKLGVLAERSSIISGFAEQQKLKMEHMYDDDMAMEFVGSDIDWGDDGGGGDDDMQSMSAFTESLLPCF